MYVHFHLLIEGFLQKHFSLTQAIRHTLAWIRIDVLWMTFFEI